MDDSEKTELTDANDNPWYWLATVYGEQTGQFHDELPYYDGDLAKKNRIAWNRWVAEEISEEARSTLIEKGFDAAELIPFSDIEKKEHYAAVLKRSDRESVTLPKPSECADFYSNRFDHHRLFTRYLFPTTVDFRSATFISNADFQESTFGENALFISTKFCWYATFDSVRFRSYVGFSSAIFSKDASFRRATFHSHAEFGPVTFGQKVTFESATFYQYAYFGSARFNMDANFNAVQFHRAANFINTKFSSTTQFSEVVYRSAVPKFFGATLHEGTEWHGVEWPSPTPNLDDDDDKEDTAQQQVYAYERLKQEMEKLKKHEDEQFFFRKELRARRELHTWRSTYWWLNFLYEKLSNYGYGVVRPLVAFAALFFAGFALLALDPFGFAGTKMSAWHAAHISLANMFGGIPLRTIARNADDVLARPAQAFAIFQTIAGVVLLFLFFLALRNRFRLR
jgi:hypothetical protein